MMLQHLRRMARYNRWANQRLYAACAQLPRAEYHKARPAFFGSLHGTLNHLVVTDRIWLARILSRPTPPYRLDQQLYDDLESLQEAREQDDLRLIEAIEACDAGDLGRDAVYRPVTNPGHENRTPIFLCWLHMFNHQTHHRGQAHDQLSQTSEAPPPLDLLFYLREKGNA
jgi:uncharacterized damage-inducible protein DinB